MNKKYTKQKLKKVGYRITQKHDDMLINFCKKTGHSKSSAIRLAIEELINNWGESSVTTKKYNKHNGVY